MARSAVADRAKLKAQREKKLAAVLIVIFVALLAIEGPKTLKQLQAKPNAPVVAAGTTTTATQPAAAPTGTTPTPTATTSLVSSVQPAVSAGQLRSFALFAAKDPFRSQDNPAPPSSSSATPAPTPTPPVAPPPAPAPATPPPAPVEAPPTAAVISLNGQVTSVSVNSDFPIAGAVFDRVGSLFHLASLTKKSARVTINGGSYASGQPALTLTVGKPVTLQNTADGTRYTLLLEPPGTQVPTTLAPVGASTTPATTTTATTTTPSSVLP